MRSPSRVLLCLIQRFSLIYVGILVTLSKYSTILGWESQFPGVSLLIVRICGSFYEPIDAEKSTVSNDPGDFTGIGDIGQWVAVD